MAESTTLRKDDDTPEMPAAAMLERLIRWHEKRAAADGRLALSLDAEGLNIAADTNRQRALAHRQTAVCLRALRPHCRPETAFRGHLKSADRPKAQVRAPP